MSSSLGLTLLLTLLGFALLISALVALALPLLRARLALQAPHLRARWLWLLLTAPSLLALVFLGLALLPSIAGLVFPALDHCTTHHDAHLHLCVSHWSLTAAPRWLGLLVTSGGALALLGMLHPLLSYRKQRQRMCQLERIAQHDPALSAYVLDVERPLALVTGLLQPRLLLSLSMIRGLSPNALQVMLAHERAHIERRDNLRKLLARVLSFAHLPGVRARLMDDLVLACEQACDERAAQVLGRTHVARALLDAERLCPQHRPQTAASHFGAMLEPRILALLAPPVPTPRSERYVWFILCTGLILLADPLHHITENALCFLLR